MYGVELCVAFRLAVVEEGLSHREAGRRFGIDRRTVKKMLRYSAPLRYRRTKTVRRTKLGASPASSSVRSVGAGHVGKDACLVEVGIGVRADLAPVVHGDDPVG